MKITKRLAEEDYCFVEVIFDSLEEYETEYPKFVKSYLKTKEAAKKALLDYKTKQK